METLNLLLGGFAVALTPMNLLFVLLGVLIGQIVGALPGIGPSLGMVLLLPVSFGLPPVTGIVMLSGIMYGAMYGGTITSVLINVPGESSGVMTAIEGHQLARQGRAGAALSIAAIGSFIAGTGSIVLLIVAAVWISEFALRFSSPEYFLLAAMGLLASAALGQGSTLKALLAACLGLMIALVGADPILGVGRLTFGHPELIEGIDFLPVAIGVFGIAEVLETLERSMDLKPLRMRLKDLWLKRQEWRDSRMAIARGGALGFVLGLLPGVGPTAATFLAYAAERRFARQPEKFGNGSMEALASCESANNSAVTAGMIPMLTLGIPGSGLTAVLLAAFTIHGIRPGPTLMTDQPELVWGLIASLFVGNAMLLILNLPFAPVFASLLRIPYAYLAPFILVLSLVGAYAASLSLFVVGLTLAFGLIGYFMIKAQLPRAPLVLAVVLGPIMESSLRQTLILSQGSLAIFIERPVAAALLGSAMLIIAWPLVRMLRSAGKARWR